MLTINMSDCKSSFVVIVTAVVQKNNQEGNATLITVRKRPFVGL